MLLFFDTETTGVKPGSFLVQLAAILTENDGTLRGSCNFIIKPEGYTIPEEASRIHGITNEIALRSGVPLAVGIAAFNNFALQCVGGKIVAHNIKFDKMIMEGSYKLGGWPSRFTGVELFCTMEASKNKVKSPATPKMVAAGIRGYKAPRLEESYEFAFKKKLENAHDALYDVTACRDVYFWLLKGDEDERPATTPEMDRSQQLDDEIPF